MSKHGSHESIQLTSMNERFDNTRIKKPPQKDKGSFLKGVSLCLISAFTYSLMALSFEYIASVGVSLMLSMFTRCLTQFALGNGAVFLLKLSYCPKRRDHPDNSDGLVRYVFLQGLFNTLSFTFYFLAITKLNVGVATAIFFTAPVWAAIGGRVVLKDNYGVKEVVAAFGFLAGIAVIAVGKSSEEKESAGGVESVATGVLLGMCASLLWGMNYVWLRKLGGRAHPSHIVLGFSGVGVVVGFVGLLFDRGLKEFLTLTLKDIGVAFVKDTNTSFIYIDIYIIIYIYIIIILIYII
eukprot:GHVR01004155.1.p1 GENE.GHVR01004155.1~~GHVR01004155.1.p1  ORF type:complete len:295 (-),score=71.50 GHVR01004155.1:593-1477(-)